jgi:hypothetical protein
LSTSQSTDDNGLFSYRTAIYDIEQLLAAAVSLDLTDKIEADGRPNGSLIKKASQAAEVLPANAIEAAADES